MKVIEYELLNFVPGPVSVEDVVLLPHHLSIKPDLLYAITYSCTCRGLSSMFDTEQLLLQAWRHFFFMLTVPCILTDTL